MTDIKKEWDVHATNESQDPFHGESREFVDEVILQEIGDINDKTLIDLGCGNGDFTYKAYERGAIVTGIDISEEMYKKAKTKYPMLDLKVHEFGKGDLPYERKFDYAIAELVVMFVKDIDGFLDDVKRVIKSDGKLIVVLIHPFFVLASSQIAEGKGLSFDSIDNYFVEKVLKLETDEVDLTYFSRSVSWYVKKFDEHGFKIESMAEPELTAGHIELHPRYQDIQHLPYLLLFELSI